MERLRELSKKNGPLCVGLDTDPAYIPESVLRRFGGKAEAVFAYNKEIINRIATDKSACCCKVQIAYYEAMGVAGMSAYAKTLSAVRAAGLSVISDIKRGDIANTAEAYARAHFSGDFETDIVTVNPYMGFDTLSPFVEFCKKGKGIFVLLHTSNPGAADIERRELKDGGAVFGIVGSELKRLAKECTQGCEASCCPSVGAVVGCTEESDARFMRDEYSELFFLIPGYGAQGGKARVAATLLGKAGGVVNSSRALLCAWKNDADLVRKADEGTITLSDMADAAARSALSAKEELGTSKNCGF